MPSSNRTIRRPLPTNVASDQPEVTGAPPAAIPSTTAAPAIPPRAIHPRDRTPITRISETGPGPITTDPGRIEARGQLEIAESRAAQRKRCAIIAGIGSACALVVGLAMKAAGCTYTDIQWPITTVAVVTGMFLTPAYAKCIA